MNRKTYVALSKDLGEYFREEMYLGEEVHKIVSILSAHFKRDNPNFNLTRFQDAIDEAKRED